MKRLLAKFIRFIAVTLSLVAFSLLGWIVGSLIGRSGVDPVVLSAVLPVLLTGAGGFFIFKSEDKEGINSIVLSLSVILFLSTLAFGIISTVNAVRQEELRYIEYERELHYEALQDCIQMELQINYAREQLGLPPLKTEVIMETICGLR